MSNNTIKLVCQLKKSLFLLVALMVSLPAFSQDKVIDQIIAVVGGNIILKSDIEEEYKARPQGMTSQGDMRCEIFENLLVNKLLLAEAELDTLIEATPSQINQQMEGMLQQYIEYFNGEKGVEDYFKKPITSIKAEMQERVKSQILTSQMQQKIVQDVTVTPAEVRAFYRSLKEDEIPVIPTQYEYQQITLMPPIDLAEENRVKEKLRELKKRIEDGTSFGALAIMESDGPGANNGGELPYQGRAEMEESYASAAFNLKPGKVSNVVKTEMGYHIIQLIDRKGEKIKTRHIMLKPKISTEELEKVASKLDSLADIIRKNEITFEQAASMFSYDKNSRNNGGMVINPETQTSKFKIEQLDGDASKVVTKLKINEISDPFKSIDENQVTVYKIIKLIRKIDGHPANLLNDYQQIAEVFLADKKDRTLREWIAKQQSDTYIRIDPTYANCNFKFENWIK